MEKLMYLTWLGDNSTRSEVSEVMLGQVGEQLLALDPVALTVDVWDPESDIPAPVPTPEGETPLHGVVSLWVDTIEQGEPFEVVLEAAAVRLAGYPASSPSTATTEATSGRHPAPGPTVRGRPACSRWRSCSSTLIRASTNGSHAGTPGSRRPPR